MTGTSFINSLSGRMLLFGVLPTLLAISLIVAWETLGAYESLRRSEEHVLATGASGAAAELSVRNERWNNFAATVALGQTHGLFGRRKETIEFVRSVNALSDLNLSVYVAYEPNADGQDAASLKAGDIPREAMDATGRFLPVWYDVFLGGVRSGTDGLRASVGMESMDYYLVPKAGFSKAGKPAATMTEPYEDDGKLIVSHAFPIVIRGEFAGVAGANRSLDAIAGIAVAMKTRTGADVFIISPGGRFIAATTDSSDDGKAANNLRMRPLSETPYAAIGSRWKSASAGGDVDTFWDKDPLLGTECLYAVEKSKVGDWTVVSRRTKADVMQAADANLLRNVITGSAALLLIGGILSFVTRSVSRRVRSAAEVAERIARGDLTQPIVATAGHD
jgi:hypothetical protein